MESLVTVNYDDLLRDLALWGRDLEGACADVNAALEAAAQRRGDIDAQMAAANPEEAEGWHRLMWLRWDGWRWWWEAVCWGSAFKGCCSWAGCPPCQRACPPPSPATAALPPSLPPRVPPAAASNTRSCRRGWQRWGAGWRRSTTPSRASKTWLDTSAATACVSCRVALPAVAAGTVCGV